MSGNNLQNFIFYTTPKSKVSIDVLIQDETVWLTQKRMGELFNVSVPTINEHLKDLYFSNEIDEISTIRKFRIVQKEGNREVERDTNFYNLDTIISVGYRVNSIEATEFRKWATSVLRDYVIKGFSIDDELLKNGTRLGKDYFKELLERVRDIRASERRFYQKITDIYSTAIDYSSNSKVTKEFFQTVQNKLHFAIVGQTSAEVIVDRVDSGKKNMGLTTWKNSPDGKIMKSDVSVAKNYLTKEEIASMNRIVGMYLDYAEDQAEKGIPMHMKDWREKLDAFLDFNERDILDNPGKVKAEVAKKIAEGEYEKFKPVQDLEFKSDFDRYVEGVEGKG